MTAGRPGCLYSTVSPSDPMDGWMDGFKNKMHLQFEKKEGMGGVKVGGGRGGDLYILPLTRPFCFSTTSHWLAVSWAYTKDNTVAIQEDAMT
jgi:hypothetical protein